MILRQIERYKILSNLLIFFFDSLTIYFLYSLFALRKHRRKSTESKPGLLYAVRQAQA